MAAPTQVLVTIHLDALDPARRPQDIARHLRSLASLVDTSGTLPDAVKDLATGKTVLSVNVLH